MLCCVPGYPGERFWQRERLLYGVLPFCAALTLFALAAVVWLRFRHIKFKAMYRTTFYIAMSALAIIWVGTVLAVLLHSG